MTGPTTSPAHAVTDHATSEIRALVVDDDPNFRLLLRHQLRREGVETAEAATPGEAFAAARRHPPDVIVLDWRLGGESGLELCRRLRADPDLGSTPVLMLTGLSDPRDRAAALQAGASAMLTKGAAPELPRLVANLARARR